MIGHQEEEIVEDLADEDLVFQSGITCELLMTQWKELSVIHLIQLHHLL